MDITTAHILNYTTSAFYQQEADTFSQTRNAPWEGWQEACRLMDFSDAACEEPFILADIGCGNLRFERFLEEKYSSRTWEFYLVDNCEQLIEQKQLDSVVHYSVTDVIGNILEYENPFDFPQLDAAVMFGVMHHVPGNHARLQLIETILERVKPDGFVCLSFWEFAKHTDLRVKAAQKTVEALEHLPIDPMRLDAGDYLLGWQDTHGLYRYCHSFTDEEIQSLIGQLNKKARTTGMFHADGRTGDLNCYVILQRC